MVNGLSYSELKDFLDEKYFEYNQRKFIESDPIQIPHTFSKKEDIEISSFLTATIAWGQRKTIIKNSFKMMELLDNSPHEFVLNSTEKEINKLFIKHRTFNEIDFRYIELMQTGDNIDYFNNYHVPAKKFTDYLNNNNWIIQTFGKDAGPSKNYLNPKFKGKFGVIAPYSKDFCKSCNRLRITAKGDLRLCLFGNTGINIRHLMQKDSQIEELKDLILKQLNFKKESHYLEIGDTGLTKNLSTTGG